MLLGSSPILEVQGLAQKYRAAQERPGRPSTLVKALVPESWRDHNWLIQENDAATPASLRQNLREIAGRNI